MCFIDGHHENNLTLLVNNTNFDPYNLVIYGGLGCQLRLLAMGMGGHGNASGGGSGFIRYHTIPELSNAHSPYTVSILTVNMNISVNIYGTGGFEPVVIAALPGQDAIQSKGGNGYSGGKTAV